MFMIFAKIKTLLLWFAMQMHISSVIAWIFSVFLQWLRLFIAVIVFLNIYFRFLAAFEHALFLTCMCLQLENYMPGDRNGILNVNV